MNTIMLLTTGLGLVMMGIFRYHRKTTELSKIEAVLNDYMVGGTERDASRQSGSLSCSSHDEV